MRERYSTHQYAPTEMIAGAGSVESLATLAAEHDSVNAMVVCGQTTGGTDAVMDPVRDALGDRLAHVYDGVESHVPTTNVETAIATAEDVDADLLVSVGGRKRTRHREGHQHPPRRGR